MSEKTIQWVFRPQEKNEVSPRFKFVIILKSTKFASFGDMLRPWSTGRRQPISRNFVAGSEMHSTSYGENGVNVEQRLTQLIRVLWDVWPTMEGTWKDEVADELSVDDTHLTRLSCDIMIEYFILINYENRMVPWRNWQICVNCLCSLKQVRDLSNIFILLPCIITSN